MLTYQGGAAWRARLMADIGRRPHVRKLLVRKGTTFRNAVDAFPLCCPSRATFNTGQYPHNHGVTSNGGAHQFDNFGADTIQRQLHDAGLEPEVVAVVGNSPAVAAAWATPLAFLFIDGGHGADPARRDYEGWTPHVAPGGLLAGEADALLRLPATQCVGSVGERTR